MPVELITTALATLIVAIDPLGLAPIFAGLTQAYEARVRRRIALIATVLSIGILAFFALFGERLLLALGIEIPAFRVAGGLLLFYAAFEMMFGQRTARRDKTAHDVVSEDENPNTIAAFPLAIPLMAGPGAITAVILLAAKFAAVDNGQVILIGIVASVCLLCLFCFLAADALTRLLGDIGRVVLTRLLGLILAALAVQFIADGVRGLIAASPA
jgi:multiple antibiotic resistance protein